MGRTACTEPQCLYKGALYLTFTLLLSTESTSCHNSGIHNSEADPRFLEIMCTPDPELLLCVKSVKVVSSLPQGGAVATSTLTGCVLLLSQAAYLSPNYDEPRENLK
jgi:hypothetical protein